MAIDCEEVWAVEACLKQRNVVYECARSGCAEPRGGAGACKRPHTTIDENNAKSVFYLAREEDVANTVGDCGNWSEDRCLEWVIAVDRAATGANGSMASNCRHTALAAVTPYFPNTISEILCHHDVAKGVRCYAEWVTEVRVQRIDTVLTVAVQKVGAS